MKRSLKDTTLKAAKAKEKAYRLTDGGGLYVYVKTNGSKLWRYDCKVSSRRITLSFGEYPAVTIKKARELHELARADIADGVDPRARYSKAHQLKSFSEYAYEAIQEQSIAVSTKNKKILRFNKYLQGKLDHVAVNEITTQDLYKLCKPIADAGKHETAKIIASIAKLTFKRLLILQVVENNPASDLGELLPPIKREANFAHTLDLEEIKTFLCGFDDYPGEPAVQKALQLLPHVFLRPQNIRFLKWEYINFNSREIVFPELMMKSKKHRHVAPLSEQALKIILSMKELTGKSEYVFDTGRSNKSPMSENTLNVGIKRIINPKTGKPFGTGTMTSHGWRHFASTNLHEMGFESDLIEIQMAHINKDRVKSVYNKAEYLPKRHEMMQAWSDFLDKIKGT